MIIFGRDKRIHSSRITKHAESLGCIHPYEFVPVVENPNQSGLRTTITKFSERKIRTRTNLMALVS